MLELDDSNQGGFAHSKVGKNPRIGWAKSFSQTA
jgi:hypothetical protein